MLNLEQKKAVVADLRARSEAAQAAILADYRGLTVDEVTSLRAELTENGVYFKVVKNNLAKRAVDGTDLEPLAEHFSGPTAMALTEDPVAAAKVLTEFAKNHQDLEIKAGVLQGKTLSGQDLEALAQLPDRHTLLTQLAVGLNAPITKLARDLNAVPAKFARALAAVRDQKGEAA
ncbi:50S ribosomal protein L10 [Thiohalorhabdus methylotrophus]|uniref:Large ribosomal subunit protein uL10 n=1 Tax=Thiohalorhabdus methylotrophus TaxID=3242694 RepID=A0ABV4TQQ1_9GAMM